MQWAFYNSRMSKSLVVDLNNAEEPLSNILWERFAMLYATDSEFFGNGVQTYIETYDIDTSKKGAYNAAAASASALLKNPVILARINHYLESRMGLSDAFADKQLAFVMAQSADLRSKMAAIREYNALKGRIKQKIEHSFIDTPDTELDNELLEIERELTLAQALLSSKRVNDPSVKNGMPNLTDAQKATQSQEVV